MVPAPKYISNTFTHVDAAIDHAHKEIMSLGLNASRGARTLIRKSIVLSIGHPVFGKGLQSEDSVAMDWKGTSAIIKQSHGVL